MAEPYLNYIEGRWVASEGGLLESRNPATGELVARFQNSLPSDVHHAAEAARRAFDSGIWSNKPPRERSRVLFKIADLMRQAVDNLAPLLTKENGKTLTDTRGEVTTAASILEYYGTLARSIQGSVPRYTPEDVSLVVREPVGVCGLIVPWNSPLLLASWKLGPALAAGCTMVLKPSEYTPAVSLEMVKLFDSIEELPKGVLNAVTGTGEPAGSGLVKDPLVDKISFTGSTATGSKIMEMAAGDLKRINLECGGKSANIVFEDANLSAALTGSLWAIFRSAGQSCNAGSRLLIQESIYEKFLSDLVDRAKKIKVGNGLDPETEMGPLVSEGQLKRVLDFIDSGVKEGAKLLCGGKRIMDGALAEGFFVEPTIFSEVTEKMRVFQEEIFGPVLSVHSFKSDEEAVQLANATKYGLAGNIWSRDVARILRVSRKIRTGTLWVNRHLNPGPEVPFGGYKRSGIGRETGLEGLNEYLQTKHISLGLGVEFERLRR
jgi:betaine-aldehyde dehydrogenase